MEQRNTFASHEHPPRLSWEGDFATFHWHIKRIRVLQNSFRWVYDVSHWWLPYLKMIEFYLPKAKFIVLRRNKLDTINSFASIKGDKVDHWRDSQISGANTNSWDACYPTYDATSRTEAIAMYYDHYYGELEKFTKISPEKFLWLETETAFNKDNQAQILDFCGHTHKNLISEPHLNSGTMRDGARLRTTLT